MNKCPFCNSEPEIKEVINELHTDSPSSAKNIELVRVVHSKKGKPIFHVYHQTQYIVRCSNKECIAYHMHKRFWSEDLAYEAWNSRQ